MRKLAFAVAMFAAALQAVPAAAATFLFIRHAESEANVSSSTTDVDPPLTALGQQQAQALAGTLSGYDVTHIYTSAYQRTQQTIAPTATLFGIAPVADARMNEWYVGDTTSPDDISYDQVIGIIGQWAMGDTAAKANLPNAESLDDLTARVIPAWWDVINAHNDEDGVVLLVGHGAQIGMVMPFFAKNIDLGFAMSHGMPNAGIIELKLVDGEPYVTNWLGTNTAVPEPATWAMMLIGFGLIGTMARRGRRLQPLAA